MCGRYLLIDEAFDIRDIIAAAEKNSKPGQVSLPANQPDVATSRTEYTANRPDVATSRPDNAASQSDVATSQPDFDLGRTTPEVSKALLTFRAGEIFPGSIAPIIDKNNEARFMLWGFPSPIAGKPPLINARSETAAEKRTFRDSMESRRCLVPASGYYEWKAIGKKQKEKYEFTLPDGTSMYMAGIYTEDDEFAILTRAASPSVIDVHDRMPVILPKSYGDIWLSESPVVIIEALTEMYSRHVPKRDRQQQMSLFS